MSFFELRKSSAHLRKGEGMKKPVFIILALVVTVYLFGCAKKEQSLTEMQEPISIEELGATGGSTIPEVADKTEPVVATPSTGVKAGALLPSAPLTVTSKPTLSEIQTALMNAGYYTGSVDGKKGPLTKKAIEDFQKANNLEVDGKVGPKTWVLLSAHLNPAPVSAKTSKKR